MSMFDIILLQPNYSKFWLLPIIVNVYSPGVCLILMCILGVLKCLVCRESSSKGEVLHPH